MSACLIAYSRSSVSVDPGARRRESRSSRRPKSGSPPSEQMDDRARPEDAPDDRRRLERRLLVAGSRSIRAASTAWTVSGIAKPAARSPSAQPRRPLDEHAAVDELADELLDEERVALGALDDQARAGRPEAPPGASLEHARDVSARTAASSQSTVAFRFPTPHPGRWSKSSGRAVASTRTGAARRDTSRSRRSSRSGSAQWMSSTSSDSGLSTASSSTNSTAAACRRSRASSGWRSGATSSPRASPRISRPSSARRLVLLADRPRGCRSARARSRRAASR